MCKTVLCADYLCKHNSGSGYYGICQHPVQPMYTGGIDRMYMNSCKLGEAEKSKGSIGKGENK